LTEVTLNPVGVKSGAVREGNRVKTALAAPIYRKAGEPYVRKSSSHGFTKIGVVPSERRSMSAAIGQHHLPERSWRKSVHIC